MENCLSPLCGTVLPELSDDQKVHQLCDCIASGQLLAARRLLPIPQLEKCMSNGKYAGITALHLAAREGQVEMVELLLNFVHPDVTDINGTLSRVGLTHKGQTPLFYAAARGAIACMRTLLENGASINHSDHHGASVHSTISYTNYDTSIPHEVIMWRYESFEEGTMDFGCTANQCGIYLFYIPDVPLLHLIARELTTGRYTAEKEAMFESKQPMELQEMELPVSAPPTVLDTKFPLLSDRLLTDTIFAFKDLVLTCKNPWAAFILKGLPPELLTLIICYLGDTGRVRGTGDVYLQNFMEPLENSEKMLWAMMGACPYKRVTGPRKKVLSASYQDNQYGVSVRIDVYNRLKLIIKNGWSPLC